jgi:hypothetical protein
LDRIVDFVVIIQEICLFFINYVIYKKKVQNIFSIPQSASSCDPRGLVCFLNFL